MRGIGGAGLALVLLAACGSEAPRPASFAAPPPGAAAARPAARPAVGNRAPVVESVQLEPREPLPGERITAKVQVSDPDGDRVQLRYQWWQGDRRAAASESSLLVQGSRGSRVALVVTASDGMATSQPVRDEVRVGNRRPVIEAVRLEPEPEITVAHAVSAVPEAMDPDGDPIEFRYEWRVNGQLVHRDGPVLEPEAFRRGDEIELWAVADDGDEESEFVRGEPVRVANSAPEITSAPGGFDDQGVFRYAVELRDADGDRMFRYRLARAPSGMTLDPVNGRLQWAPTPEQEGSHSVEIEVDDRNGGVARQRFQIEVGFETAAEQTSPAAPSRSGLNRGSRTP